MSESTVFLSAFKDQKARDLVHQMMIHNYTEAIMEHHPHRELLERESIEAKCDSLCNTIFRKIEAIHQTPALLSPLLNDLARNHQTQPSIWFEEFSKAYDAYKHGGKLIKKAPLLTPYLRGTSYCDVGCGGGDLVAFMKKEHPSFLRCTGIDVLDWRTESLKDEIGFQMIDFSRPGSESPQAYDTATCIAVLHHVGSTDESRRIFLMNLRSAIAPGGRLIVEEDVILPREEVEASQDFLQQVSLCEKEQYGFSDFTGMTREEQHRVLTIIDVLGNTLVVGVQQMAFPFGFNSIEAWVGLFSVSGYKVEQIRINGFTPGMFNQSSHVVFILQPN